ncbi:MAG: hypothetical protein AB7N76_12865 [Planctomycetota bacterium]
MSYDLWFKAERPVTARELRAYFGERPHFEVDEERAFYENPDTSVYFSFELGDEQEEGRLPVAFNVNYYRPHVFGLEAEVELTRFVERFGLTVDDPQADGMGEGAYSPDGFLRGWNAGNAFGHQAILGRHPEESPLTLPAAELERWWSWNYLRNGLMQEFEGTLAGGFVPTAMFLVFPDEPERVQVCAVWGEAIPIALPQGLDQVILVGEGLSAPRYVPAERVDEVLDAYPVVPAGSVFQTDDGLQKVRAAYRNVFYEGDEPPAGLWRSLLALPGVPLGEERPARAALSQVMTRELVEAVRAGR